MKIAIETLSIGEEPHVIAARQHARRLGDLAGLGAHDQTRFAIAVFELAHNALVHAGGGTVSFALADGMLLAAIEDRGPGIADAEAVLATPEHGLAAARELSDTFTLTSAPDRGTTVEIGQRIAPPSDPEAAVRAWSAELARYRPHSAATELRVSRSGELESVRLLQNARAELERNAEELRQLRQEIEQTDLGLMALHEELEQARAAAEAATAARATFLANMSHEIRTPLNAIIGMASLLADAVTEPREREFAQTIVAGGDHLLTVINEILDFSKIDSGKLELAREPVLLADVLEICIDLVAPRAVEKGIEVVYEIAPDVPPGFIGDAARVRQVLLNLLGNAVKFTERGEVVVSVSSAPIERGLVELRFSVRDSGIGIAPEHAARLFKPFGQADLSTTRKYGGTGLGLAITKKLVELMGGTTDVTSQLGEGSTFRFSLRAEPHAARDEAFEEAKALVAGRRVHVAERNDALREALRSFLEQSGLRASASASLERASADAVIVDERLEPDPAILRRAVGDVRVVMIRAMGSSSLLTDPSPVISRPVKYRDVLRALRKAIAPRATKSVQNLSAFGAAAMPSSLRVLVAEDNPVNRKVAEAMLKRLGYSPEFVHDGAQAVEAAVSKEYDVVFMDVQMPVMDGLAATTEIVRRLGDRRPRIVGMTASALDEDRKACAAAGMDDYVSKPVTVAALTEALARVSLPRTVRGY